MELLGASKSGFKLTTQVGPTSLALRSRLDPALLYLVVGAAVLLGLAGAALAAPARAVLEAGLFAALFSPIGLYLMISALRLRANCVIDLERDQVRLVELRYLGRWERTYRLDEVGSVLLLSTAASGFPGAAPTHLLCLALPDGAYQLAEAPSGESLEMTGRALAQFLGVPLERHQGAVLTASGRRRLIVGTVLYAVPVTAAVALLSVNIPDNGSNWVFPTTLAAIVLSQVGAILSLLYYRRRAPANAGEAPLLPPTGTDSALPILPGDRSP